MSYWQCLKIIKIQNYIQVTSVNKCSLFSMVICLKCENKALWGEWLVNPSLNYLVRMNTRYSISWGFSHSVWVRSCLPRSYKIWLGDFSMMTIVNTEVFPCLWDYCIVYTYTIEANNELIVRSGTTYDSLH